MLKRTIITTILLGLFVSTLTATSTNNNYTKASKPYLVLTAIDIGLIEKAIKNNFKNLSSKDKKGLKKFLADYIESVKHEKNKSINPRERKGSDEGILEY